jgi:GT2 family glycosyltransferase
MFVNQSVKVLDIELQHPLEDLAGLDGYDQAQVLLRFAGEPLGYVILPLTNGCCPATTIYTAIIAQQGSAIAKCIILDALVHTQDEDRRSSPQSHLGPRHAGSPWPLVTVAVCTRDRTPLLTDCLASLTTLAYPALDLLVIDNAPATAATATLVRTHFPTVRYIHEPRPGLNWARNRAIAEAHGDLIAFTDDDARPDPRWIQALVQAFATRPDVMAVTGLVVPAELDTEAQRLFERYGGFGRGFTRRTFRADRSGGKRNLFYLHPGKFGTGANMAYRRALFGRIGGFDPALDVGTVTQGGGDLEMFFRVLHEGYTLVYEPSAIVRHRHRRDYAQLRQQLTDFGIGFYSYLVRTGLTYPGLRFSIARLAIWWLWRRNLRRLLLSLMRPWPFPRELIVAELVGSLRGLGRYPIARRRAEAIARAYATRGVGQASEVAAMPSASP